MKSIRLLIVAGLALAITVPVMAQSANSPVHLNNRLRLGYDDNVYQVGDPTEKAGGLSKKDSLRIIEELELLVALNMERTYLGLRYRPSFVWYEDRADDDTELLHDLDFNFTYNFTPVLALSLSDNLRASELPELHDENYIVREHDDNIYNSAIATLTYAIRPETRIDLSGRVITMVYDSKSPAKENGDYYSLVGGLTLRQQLASLTSLSGDLRYQVLTYNKAKKINARDADTIFAGVGAEQTFSPKMIGSLRAGISSRSYDDSRYDDQNMPYGEGSITFLPSPATRITASASYSIYESEVERYLSQNRTYFSLSLAHDITAKLNFYASSAFSMGAYEKDYAMDADLYDADENSYLVSLRLSYRINRINWIEVGYQFVKLDSEIKNRESYERNRVDIGWKIQLF